MRVIKLRRTKGWRMPAGVIICDRRTKWGNPFKTAYAFQRWLRDGLIAWAELRPAPAYKFERWDALDSWRATILRDLPAMKGKTWACWCIDWPDDGEIPEKPVCHAQVLWMLANG